MREEEDNCFIDPQNLISCDVTAFFTTRSVGDNLGVVAERYNSSRDNIYIPIQKHTDNIHILDAGTEPVIADAVITEKKGVIIGVQVADCVPVLLYDRFRNVIGAVHAGWRGTAQEILKGTIRAMQERFDSSPENILIAIGPSIRQCCYEVGDEVETSVRNVTGEGNYYINNNNKCFIDLSSANKIQALSVGIPEENIWQSEECTFCNPDKFHSFRHAKKSAGRQGGFIGMW
jgi:YfiH family protein